jgi:tetratricopeptide (TPR) repeat protein
MGRRARKLNIPLRAFLATSILAGFIVVTRSQLPYWQNGVTLFSHAIEAAPDNIFAEYLLGTAFAKQGNQEKAALHYQKALELPPNRVESSRNSQCYAHLQLGEILAAKGKFSEAEAHFIAALHLQPNWWRAHSDLGDCQLALGHFEDAISQYKEALKVAPPSAHVWRRLGIAFVREGNSEAALKAYREALRLNPDGAVELNDLAWFLATDSHSELRDGPEAIRLAQRACELTAGSEPRCLGTLDAALAEAGHFNEAIATAQMTREAALSRAEPEVATAAEGRLSLYRAKKPYRQE